MEEPDDKETAWAGVLTGVMISLLGVAFPAFLAWALVTGWKGFLITEEPLIQGIQVITISGFSLQAVWYGIRVVRHNVRWLRGR